MAEFINIDFSQVENFGRAFEKAPQRLLRSTAIAFKRMGASDIDRLKAEQLSGGAGRLKIKSKGLKKAFKFHVPSSPKDFSQLKLDEYTGAKIFRIFETGGTITPKRGRLLTILTPAARNSSGKRKWTQKQLTSMIKSGELRVVKSKKVLLIVRNVGGRVKSGPNKGAFRSGARNEIIAYMVPSVRLRKMLDFYGNFNRNSKNHDAILGRAADEALEEIVQGAT